MIKYLVNDNCSIIKFNDETLEANTPSHSREAIRSVLLIDEPGVLVDEDGNETNVKSGDIVIRFYESVFPKRTIAVKSKDWKNNIIAFNKAMEAARKEEDDSACCEACDKCYNNAN